MSENNNTGLTVTKAENDAIANTVIGKNAQALNDIVMDNINKLKTDASYLAQAKEIREQVGQLVDIGKLQVEMIKVMKG